MRSWRFTALVLLCLAPALHARAGRLEKWNRALVGIDDALKAGKYAQARGESIRVTRWMLEGLGSGPDAMYTLAVAGSFRALAEAGLGNTSEAEWYWCVATQLFPAFHGTNLAVYGRAGELIRDFDRSLDVPPASSAQDLTRAVPPVVLRKAHAKYPMGAIDNGLAQVIVVEVTISRDGLAKRPRIVDTGWEPSLAFAALEAVKEWRFRPASLDGQPVEFRFPLTVSFQLRY